MPLLCFVLMPFGHKPVSSGALVDFDAVYRELIQPAIEAAGMQPLRADEEMAGGIIHKPMFERLILCEYAIADLTTANANVFYELGLRHAVRPWSTVLVFAEGTGQLPFDVAPLRGLPYRLGGDGQPTEVERSREVLVQRLAEARNATVDSPVFQLVEDFPDVQRLKTDVFRERVRYSEEAKRQLAAARRQGVEAVRAFAGGLGDIANMESAVVIDLFLSFRAVKAWQDMIDLVDRMAPPLAETVMVQEQLALALNRAGRGEDAERVLLDLIAKRGPSSETYGILGRVYKDRWEAAAKAGDALLAAGLLDKAIDAYRKGFETDWRDAYPGINAITLLDIKGDEASLKEKKRLLPVVSFAVEQRLAGKTPDYWDYATMLELAVLNDDPTEAMNYLAKALAVVRESWEPKTTANNLRMIQRVRVERGAEADWLEPIIDQLES